MPVLVPAAREVEPEPGLVAVPEVVAAEVVPAEVPAGEVVPAAVVPAAEVSEDGAPPVKQLLSAVDAHAA